MRVIAKRYHDISCGHRVVGHENKCRFLHGHNYRFHFSVTPLGDLDEVGRVIDFSVIKTLLAQWLEDNFDHKMLIWSEDPLLPDLLKLDKESIFVVPFNPTAENIAKYMIQVVGPKQLKGTNTQLIKCEIDETRKCSASAEN